MNIRMYEDTERNGHIAYQITWVGWFINHQIIQITFPVGIETVKPSSTWCSNSFFCTMLHKVCQLVKKKIFATNFPLCKKGYLFVYIWLVFILNIYRIWMEAQLYERYIFNLMLLLMMILMMIKTMMMMLREREKR